MKKLVLALCILLAPMAVVAQECPSAQADPAVSPAMTALAQEIFSPVSQSLERGILQQPAPSWCTNRNNNYCTYGWDWSTRCCYPTYTQPGALCEWICE